jgi:hypothetical protein
MTSSFVAANMSLQGIHDFNAHFDVKFVAKFIFAGHIKPCAKYPIVKF